MLSTEPVGRLGLLDDEIAPRVLPVTFALHEGALWSAVDEKRKYRRGRALARVRFLEQRPRAALTVDHYEHDWSTLAWVQALGDVEVMELERAPDALSALRAKYPQYREQAPRGPLLCLRPARLLCWRASG
jgi:PPOX class probable F420-dependent enzyme